MKISKKYQYEYVSCLPKPLEKEIMTEVSKSMAKLLLNKEEKQETMENANCSKVCSLEDTIKIQYVV